MLGWATIQDTASRVRTLWHIKKHTHASTVSRANSSSFLWRKEGGGWVGEGGEEGGGEAYIWPNGKNGAGTYTTFFLFSFFYVASHRRRRTTICSPPLSTMTRVTR